MGNNNPHLLLADPALRNFGFAVFDLSSHKVSVLDNIATKRDSSMGVADSDIQSVATIVHKLRSDCFSKYNVVAAIIEHSTGGALDHRSSRTLALSEALVVSVCSYNRIPMMLVTQGEVKQSLLGKRSGEKDEIEDIVLKYFPRVKLPKSKSKRSHPVDALALLIVGIGWERIAEYFK